MRLGEAFSRVGELFSSKRQEAPQPTIYTLNAERARFIDGLMLESSRFRVALGKDDNTTTCTIKVWKSSDEESKQKPLIKEDLPLGGQFDHAGKQITVTGFGSASEDRNHAGTTVKVNVPYANVSVSPLK